MTTTSAIGPDSLNDDLAIVQEGDIITFDSNLSGTISLVNSLPLITSDIIIRGPTNGTVIIDGSNKYQIFNVASGSLTLSNITLNNALNSSPGGALNIEMGASASLDTVSLSGSDGNVRSGDPLYISPEGTLQTHNVSFSTNHISTEKNILLDTDSSYILTSDAMMQPQIIIEGTGNIRKEGEGTVVLTTAASSTAVDIAITVHKGTVIFTGTSTEPIFVNQGGTIQGNFSVLHLVNSGTVKPGTIGAIGAISLTNDYSQTEGSNLQIEVLASGAIDSVQVGGNAFLSGSLTLLPDNGMYFKGDSYTFLTTNGDINGTFDSFSSIAPGFIFSVQYLQNSIQIEVLKNVLSLYGGTFKKDAQTVKSILENADVTRGSDLAFILTALNALDPPSPLEQGLEQLHPGPFWALGWVDASAMHQINARIVEQRSSFCGRPCMQMTKKACCPLLKNNGLWVSGIGEKIHQSSVSEMKGFHDLTKGVLIGYDRSLGAKATIGLASGYTHANIFWRDHGGNTKTQGAHTVAYSSFCLERLQVDASILGSYYHYDVSRNIIFPGIDRTAKSSLNGFGVMGHLGASLLYSKTQVNLSPFVGIDYTSLWRSRFKEHGAESINLKGSSTRAGFVRTEIGLSASQEYCLGWATFVPSASLSWVYFAQVTTSHVKTHLEGIMQEFTINLTKHGYNEIAPAVSLGFILGDNFWISASYSGEFGPRRMEQELTLNLRWQF